MVAAKGYFGIEPYGNISYINDGTHITVMSCMYVTLVSYVKNKPLLTLGY